MTTQTNTYNEFADQYANLIEQPGENFSAYHQLIVPALLEEILPVTDLMVLDAGCGEGHIARLLAVRGARVTAVDVAPRLIENAKMRTTESAAITYMVHNLSQPLPESYTGSFDLIVSNLVLNDVYDYVAYIQTLQRVLKSGGRLVITLNNPYSAVIREKVQNYFESGKSTLYSGLAQAGVEVYYIHRTLEEIITACLSTGLALRRFSDLSAAIICIAQTHQHTQKHYHFPYFMLLSFVSVCTLQPNSS